MSFPLIVIRGPSAMIFLAFFMTTLLLILKLDKAGSFPFPGDTLLILAPIHIVFVKLLFYIINTQNKQSSRLQRDSLDLLDTDDDDDDGDELSGHEVSDVAVFNTALGTMAMLLWPTFIFMNMKLEFDPNNEYSWGWALWPFLGFCFYMFTTGLNMGIIWWTDGRNMIMGDGV